jgi:cytochrome c oxidase subunit 3
MNTPFLIASSVTVVLAWAALKMRDLTRYKIYMTLTILCGVIFLVVKLTYEWPQKFEHFGAFIKEDALGKYEQYLGNRHLLEKGLSAAQGNYRAPSQQRSLERSQHQRLRDRARSG